MNALVESLGRQPRRRLLGGCFGAIGVVTALSYVAGPELALPLLYVIPVAAIAWFGGVAPGLLASCLAALLELGLTRLHARTMGAMEIWNLLIRTCSLGSLAYLLGGFASAWDYARTDDLTGIPNARAFRDAAENESRRSRRYGGAFTILFLDVDDLQSVNARFGRSVGDALLRSLATTVRSRMRRTDVVARLGQDHFAVLMPETDAEAAQGVVGKLEAVLRTIADKGPWTSGFSVGAATFTTPPESIESALHHAEDLMRAARTAQDRVPHGVRCVAESVPASAARLSARAV